jgi:hypothetical protein
MLEQRRVNMKVMTIAALLLCSGCFVTIESQREAQECNIDHSERIVENLKEIERVSASGGLTRPVIDRLNDIRESAHRIGNWSRLTRADIGRAKAKPQIMTDEELQRQGVYKSRIALKEKLSAAAGLGLGESNGILGWITGLSGGGLALSIAAKLFGGQRQQLRDLGQKYQQAKAAVHESIALFREAPDNIRQMAADRPNLAKEYGEQKEEQRAQRIAGLENGNGSA